MKKHTIPTRPRRRRPSLLIVTPALLAVTAACAGPRAPLDIGAKSVQLDVLLGAKQAVAAAPLPPLIFSSPGGTPRRPSLFLPEVAENAPERVRTPRAPKPCVDDPSASPKNEAFNRVYFPPMAQSYTYGVKGKVTTGRGPVDLPSTATVEVRNPALDPITFHATWDVAATLNEDTTTTSYRARNPGIADFIVPAAAATVASTAAAAGLPGGLIIVERVEPVAPEPPHVSGDFVWPEGNPFGSTPSLARLGITIPPYPVKSQEEFITAAAKPPRGIHDGLYMEKIVAPDGKAFEPPLPGMLLAAFPLRVGTVFDVAGTDGRTTMMYRTTVKPRATVRACGIGIDTWTIELTNGLVIDEESGHRTPFTARYQVDTRSGGLIVSDFTDLQQIDVPEADVLTRIVRTVETTTLTPPGQGQ